MRVPWRMAFDGADIPVLPRGARPQHFTRRKGWFLLAPERAVKMDQIGAAIPTALDRWCSFDAVVSKLVTDFSAPADQILQEMLAFPKDLQNTRMREVRS